MSNENLTTLFTINSIYTQCEKYFSYNELLIMITLDIHG